VSASTGKPTSHLSHLRNGSVEARRIVEPSNGYDYYGEVGGETDKGGKKDKERVVPGTRIKSVEV
jgi:hypothetical protein